MDKLTLAFTLKHILQQKFDRQACKAKFLLRLAAQCGFYSLAIIDVSAYRGIPFARLNIFPQRTLLQIDSARGVEQMEMNNRMQQFTATMTLPSCSFAHSCSVFVDNGENLFVIILFYHGKTLFLFGRKIDFVDSYIVSGS